MTVPQGYKLTEVGVIPEDWDVDRVTAIALIATGAKNTQDRVDDGKYPFFVRSQTVERINSYSFDGEAVLTAGDGVGTGKIFHYINGKFDLHQRVYKISHFKPEMNGFFFYLYFSNYFYDRIMAMTAKSSVDSARREMIANMLLPIPPLPEQEAIALVLSNTDALITSLDKLIAKKRDLKQAAMQQLLTGKQRLEGFGDSSSKFKQTEIGLIPEDWEVKKLADIGYFFSGGTPNTSNPEFYGGDIPWITSGDLNQGLILNVEGRITQKGLDNSSAKLIKQGTLLIAMYGATAGVIGISLIGGAINQAILAIAPKSESIQFLYQKFLISKDWIIKTYTQGGQPNLSGKIIKSIEFPFPLLPEQEAIANVLSDMDSEISALEQRRDKTKALKQGMMQELLTGRIRLQENL